MTRMKGEGQRWEDRKFQVLGDDDDRMLPFLFICDLKRISDSRGGVVEIRMWKTTQKMLRSEMTILKHEFFDAN